jgi:hypothetical protein
MELVEALALSTLDGWTLQAMHDEEQFEGLAGAAS